jgi:hypothetical protein
MDLVFVLLDHGVYPFIRGIGVVKGRFGPSFYLTELFNEDIQDLEFVYGDSPDPFRSGNPGNMLKVGIDIVPGGHGQGHSPAPGGADGISYAGQCTGHNPHNFSPSLFEYRKGTRKVNTRRHFQGQRGKGL